MVKIHVGVYSIAPLSPKLCTIDEASRPGRIIRWGTGLNTQLEAVWVPAPV